MPDRRSPGRRTMLAGRSARPARPPARRRRAATAPTRSSARLIALARRLVARAPRRRTGSPGGSPASARPSSRVACVAARQVAVGRRARPAARRPRPCPGATAARARARSGRLGRRWTPHRRRRAPGERPAPRRGRRSRSAGRPTAPSWSSSWPVAAADDVEDASPPDAVLDSAWIGGGEVGAAVGRPERGHQPEPSAATRPRGGARARSAPGGRPRPPWEWANRSIGTPGGLGRHRLDEIGEPAGRCARRSAWVVGRVVAGRRDGREAVGGIGHPPAGVAEPHDVGRVRSRARAVRTSSIVEPCAVGARARRRAPRRVGSAVGGTGSVGAVHGRSAAGRARCHAVPGGERSVDACAPG